MPRGEDRPRRISTASSPKISRGPSPMLAGALADPDWQVRRAAARSLGHPNDRHRSVESRTAIVDRSIDLAVKGLDSRVRGPSRRGPDQGEASLGKAL